MNLWDRLDAILGSQVVNVIKCECGCKTVRFVTPEDLEELEQKDLEALSCAACGMKHDKVKDVVVWN